MKTNKEKKVSMPKFTVIKHPLIQEKLSVMRDSSTPPKMFRELLKELSALMVYEITRDIGLIKYRMQTPLCQTNGFRLAKPVVLVPILRAGLVMADGILNLIQTAKVGHIGLYRDEKSLKPVEYFCKLPKNLGKSITIIIDPMLATGFSAAKSIEIVKKRGGKDIKFVCLISCPEGYKALHKLHPDIDIYTANLDDRLNQRGYILPGLGDAGDRLFGTE